MRIAIIGADLLPEPLAPWGTPVALGTKFDSVRKAYVVTLKDQVISLPLQLNMIGQADLSEVIPIESGHSPQMAVPDTLVKAVISAAMPEVE